MHKPDPRSIRVRLTAWYAAILAATFVGVAVLVSFSLTHSIRVTVDKQLRARFATVSSYVEQEAGGQGMADLREELNEDAVVNAASAYLRIADETGSWIYRSPNTENWPRTAPKRHTLTQKGNSRQSVLAVNGCGFYRDPSKSARRRSACH